MDAKISYEFSSKVWRHNSSGSWHFISLPKNMAKEIRENLKWQEETWGRMKVLAKIVIHQFTKAQSNTTVGKYTKTVILFSSSSQI